VLIAAGHANDDEPAGDRIADLLVATSLTYVCIVPVRWVERRRYRPGSLSDCGPT